VARTVNRPAVRLVAVALAAMAIASVASPAFATRSVMQRERLARGVIYRRIGDPAIPIHTFELIFQPGTKATLDQVLSGTTMGYERTSSMAAGVGAIAAINGGLNSSPGRPTHQYVLDGNVITTGRRVGISFGYRHDEKGASVGRHPLRIAAYDESSGARLRVTSWNQRPLSGGQVVGYTHYGGSAAAPAKGQCGARLLMPGPPRYNPQYNGTHRTYTVGAVACSSTHAMNVSPNGVVLSSGMSGAGAAFLKGLPVGGQVRVSWRADSRRVLDIVSGNAQILRNGHVRYRTTCSINMCNRNPRTAIGVTANDRVIMLVVDGRTSASVGFTLHRLGSWMKWLGAVDAVNLDGGGSATMWIKGRGVVNRPTDTSGERPVSNAVVVMPGADPTEVEPLDPKAVAAAKA
jgi:Phosphodiester glycosidase